MLTNLIFFALISSGSVMASALFGKKYEQIVPLTTMGMVLLLFLFGIFGMLKAGFYAVIAICMVLYAITVCYVIFKKQYVSFLRNFCTSGMLVFLLFYLAASVLNAGMLASLWDEFSHWMDITKVMTTLDDFGTNALSFSYFKTYPPAMSLFQYGLQKLHMFLKPGALFSEWRVYLAYQVFTYSILMPFFSGCSLRKPFKLIATAVTVFALPLVFYSEVYRSVYIDAFLAILSAAGLASIFICKKKGIAYHLYIWMLCAIMVLTKDLGLFLAVILAVAYSCDIILGQSSEHGCKLLLQKSLLCGGSILSILFAKLLWGFELLLSGLSSFGFNISISGVAKLLFGMDTTYRGAVFDNFRNALFEKSVILGNTGISLNYFAMIITSIALVYFAYRAYTNVNSDNRGSKKAVAIIVIAQLLLYVFGLLIIYAFRFSKYEALNLASFNRYFNVALLAVWLMSALVLVDALQMRSSSVVLRNVPIYIYIYIVLMIVPFQPLADFVYRDNVAESNRIRYPYNAITNNIIEKTEDGDKVYLISQADTGFDYWVIRYSIRPNTVNDNFTWSIGEPFFDGDVWTKTIGADQWQQVLVESYDYVALYEVNDYFVKNYSVLFAEPDSIQNNTVFKVNKETGLLEICE